MGIIKAASDAISGSASAQWLNAIIADEMTDSTVLVKGIIKNNNQKLFKKKKNPDVVTDGSLIQVGANQFMILEDGGRIVDYTAETGYYMVDNNKAPSLLNGQFSETIADSFQRFKFGGVAPFSQAVYFINTQEIKNIPFGTSNPINYFDEFYNAELYLRAHGYFSIRIIDPIKFYTEAIPRNATKVDIKDINKLYLSEFLTALQSAISEMSVNGIRISHVTSRSHELSKYMSTVLDEEWTRKRGMFIESVGISGISYDDRSRTLIEMRNQGAMLSDPVIRESYVQGNMAQGMKTAASNPAGAHHGFMNINTTRNNMNLKQSSDFNLKQMQKMSEDTTSKVGSSFTNADSQKNGKKFCTKCGTPATTNSNFCGNCGNKF